MTRKKLIAKGIQIGTAWCVLGAILACGGGSSTTTTTDDPPPAPDPAPAAGGGGSTEAVSLSPGFLPDPHRSSGAAGGTTMAMTLQSGCAGSVLTTPSTA